MGKTLSKWPVNKILILSNSIEKLSKSCTSWVINQKKGVLWVRRVLIKADVGITAYLWDLTDTYHFSELRSLINQLTNSGTQWFCWSERTAYDQTCHSFRAGSVWPETSLGLAELTIYLQTEWPGWPVLAHGNDALGKLTIEESIK